MIKIPYEAIIEKIKQQAKISDAEIQAKIKAKMDQLSGLISKEGAAHIIANELSVKLFDATEGKMKIKDILAGMRNIEIEGKIMNLYPAKSFKRQDGGEGKVASLVIADETGSIRAVFWNDLADKASSLSIGQSVKIKDVFSKDNRNGIEVHVANRSEVTVTDTPIEAKVNKPARKSVQEIQTTDMNVEILGSLVQIFEPRFYEICPECGKRARAKDNGFSCDTHGQVNPDHAYVMNAIVDDGTGTIRTVFFRNQLENLLSLKKEEVLRFKEMPGDFQPVKEEMVGKLVKIVGKASKNEMFDRVELIAQLVYTNPNPDEELQRLQQESSVIE